MSKSYNIISMAGAVLLLAGAVLQITRWELAPYLYTLGCCDVRLCAGHGESL